MAKEKKSIWESMALLERKYLYLLLLLVVLGPMVSGIGLPVPVTPMSEQYYEVIDNLEAGDIVYDMFDINYRIYMEIRAGVLTTLKKMIEKDVKLVIGFGRPDTQPIFRSIFGDPETGTAGVLTDFMELHDYKEYEDWIALGYIIVNQAAVVSLANDFHKFIQVDWRGRSIEGTFLDDVHDASDFDLVWWQSGQNWGWPINFYGMDYGADVICFLKGANLPGASIFLDTPYLEGLAGGLRGGAELELLYGKPGQGVQAMDSFSLSHYLLIISIIVGNIGYFGWKDRRVTGAVTRVREKEE
jgi:hypothetical protein